MTREASRSPLPDLTGSNDSTGLPDPFPGEGLDLEEIRRRLEEADGDREATTELVRQLVLATIREVKARLRDYPDGDPGSE